MATPIGTDTLTSVTRRYILRDIPDNVYTRNLLTFRLIKANKRSIQGGSQIEQPLLYKDLDYGGSYSGAQVLAMGPSETIKSAAWDWKQYYVPLVFDGLTLLKNDSPESIANLLRTYVEIGEMSMANLLGDGIWSDGVTDPDGIDGLEAAVDDGTVAATYGGLLRSANTWWTAQRDASTAALTLAALQSLFGNCTLGGHSPSLIVSRQEQYNRFLALLTQNVRYPMAPTGHDEILASAGFTNALFNNVPWVIDDKVFDGPSSSNSAIVMLNEDFIKLGTHNKADFFMTPWVQPDNQDVISARLHWAGNLLFSHLQSQGLMTNVSS
jgi:hypothetical protein